MRHVPGISALNKKAIMVSLGLFGGEDLPYDKNAYNFIIAVGITDLKQQAAINQLVIDLKSAGIWNNIAFWFPMAGSTDEQHRYELKTATKRVTWSGGGLIHDYMGVKGNPGSYGLTDFVPGSAGLANSVAIGERVTEFFAPGISVAGMGVYDSAQNTFVVFQNNPSNALLTGISENAGVVHVITLADQSGFSISSGNGVDGAYTNNGNVLLSWTDTAKSWSNFNITLLARNDSGVPSLTSPAYRYTTFFFLKQYLSPAEHVSLNTIVDNFERAYRIDSYQFIQRVNKDGGIVEARASLDSRLLALEPYLLRMSLLMLPHGYKEGKLYSIIPSSGAGDFSFSRTSTVGTRKEPGGLVEPVPYNLLLQSQTLESGSWVKSNMSITPNTVIAPDGTLTADSFLEIAVTNSHGIFQSITKQAISANYALTVYIKPNGRNFILLAADTGGNAIRQWYNLSTIAVLSSQTIGSGFAVVSAAIIPSTNGFLKLTLIFSSNNQTGLTADIFGADADLSLTYPGDVTKGYFIWGSQLTQLSEKPYLVTTNRQNFPRLDYTNGAAPELLLEPARTNAAFTSEDFGSTSWNKIGSTATINQAVAPDGLSTADLLNEVAQNQFHYFEQVITTAINGITTISCFVKAQQRTFAQITIRNTDFTTIYALVTVDLTTGLTVGGINGTNAKVVDYGNGWWRVSVTSNIPVPNLNNMRYAILVYLNGTTGSYLGEPGKGIYVWGAQLEVGNYASAYIPAIGAAAVIRNQDSLTALTGVAALIGQTEGTIFFEARLDLDNVSRFISLSDGTLNNRILVYVGNTNSLQLSVATGGVGQGDIVYGTIVPGLFKVAAVYANNYLSLFVNGVKVGQDLVATIPACSRIGFDDGNGNNRFFTSGMRSFAVFPIKLSDAECIALTT